MKGTGSQASARFSRQSTEDHSSTEPPHRPRSRCPSKVSTATRSRKAPHRARLRKDLQEASGAYSFSASLNPQRASSTRVHIIPPSLPLLCHQQALNFVRRTLSSLADVADALISFVVYGRMLSEQPNKWTAQVEPLLASEGEVTIHVRVLSDAGARGEG